MMNYLEEPCPHCGKTLLIYHQYIGDAKCEGCGEWQDEPPGYNSELTPEGEQTVIPGCERNASPKAKQLDLF